MNFEKFMKSNQKVKDNVHLAVSKNFVEEDGLPILWEIKSMSALEVEQLRREYFEAVKLAGGKAGMSDYTAYFASASVVYPDLTSASLQDSYGVMGAKNLLLAMVDAGEYKALLEVIVKLNGLDKGLTELVGEAKN